MGRTDNSGRASDESRASARITLRNLIAARWTLIALVSIGVAVEWLAGDELPSGLLPSSEHPIFLLVVVAAWAGLNVPSMLALRRDRASEGLAGAHLLIDAAALTALLALSGGPANPFTILYFLPITLATAVSPRWTWVLAAACVACFAALFVLAPVESPEPAPTPIADVDPHAHHRGHDHAAAAAPDDDPHAEHFEGHQRGMWVAFGIAGVLMTVFIHRTALALARQREELARLRQTALEDRHLAAVGTLAAGAAHELGTPLATIKLLVDELPHMATDERAAALVTAGEQLARCKLIVSRMASPELRVSALGAGEAGESWQLEELVEELESLAIDAPLTVALAEPLKHRRSQLPFEVVAQVLRELVVNGAEACRRTGDADRGVAVTIQVDPGAKRLEIEVADRGIGMDPATLAYAFDPFYSTRPEGQGMGLGLYLARAHLRQLGGEIRLDSTPDRGTTVRVELPFDQRLGSNP